MGFDDPQHEEGLDRLHEAGGGGLALGVEEGRGRAADPVQSDRRQPDGRKRPQGTAQEVARVDRAGPEQLGHEARLRSREAHGVAPDRRPVDNLVLVLDPVATQHSRHERLEVRQVRDRREVADARIVQVGLARQITRADRHCAERKRQISDPHESPDVR